MQIIVDIVADDFHARRIERRHVAAQDVEMAVEGWVRFEMDTRLDHRLALALGDKASLDGGNDFAIGHSERFDVEGIEIVDIDGLHFTRALSSVAPPIP